MEIGSFVHLSGMCRWLAYLVFINKNVARQRTMHSEVPNTFYTGHTRDVTVQLHGLIIRNEATDCIRRFLANGMVVSRCSSVPLAVIANSDVPIHHQDVNRKKRAKTISIFFTLDITGVLLFFLWNNGHVN